MKQIKKFEEFINESQIKFKGKTVNIDSLGVEDVDDSDYPQFTDAFFAYGKYTNGKEMTDDELGEFSEENPELLNRLAYETLL